MEFNKITSNPMLVGSMELLKADPSPEHKSLFVSEMMKAKYMSPAMITPEPVVDENGEKKPAPGSKIQLPMLSAPDGKKFFVAFTDKMEFDKFRKEEDAPFIALGAEEYAAMLLRKDSPVLGFIINPGSANMVVPKEMLASIIAAKIAKMKEEQE
ncbi:MAG: SseB family protein [Lachnospiraceae bacterium]|nr:SseB family protein [Lachnospiraceae bacterium]